jgi:hypothetical protein
MVSRRALIIARHRLDASALPYSERVDLEWELLGLLARAGLSDEPPPDSGFRLRTVRHLRVVEDLV